MGPRLVGRPRNAARGPGERRAGLVVPDGCPVPDALRVVLDACATDETARLMASLPWMRAVDYAGIAALRLCLRGLLRPESLEPQRDDPWGSPPALP